MRSGFKKALKEQIELQGIDVGDTQSVATKLPAREPRPGRP